MKTKNTPQTANGIPIEGWTSDPSDEALLDLLPVLDSLRFTSDVRHILGLRKIGGIAQVAVFSDHLGLRTENENDDGRVLLGVGYDTN